MSLKKCRMIVLQLEIPLETVYHAIEFGNKHHIPVLFNPAPASKALDLTIAAQCDFFVPNETELEILTGMPINTLDEIREAAYFLLEKGFKNIIVTLGEKGALWVNGEIEKYIPAIEVNAVDTSGAGDAFIGCFSHYYVHTGNIEEALNKAVMFSGLSVTGKGTQSSYPSIEEFSEFLSSAK